MVNKNKNTTAKFEPLKQLSFLKKYILNTCLTFRGGGIKIVY